MASLPVRLGALLAATACAAAGTLLLSPPASAAAADLSTIRINEVESSGGNPGDWVELSNSGTSAVDVGGLLLTDSGTDPYELPAGTTIPAGGHLALDEVDFGFGLGKADAVRLLREDGTTVVDEYSWTAHATTTYGRCPDATGAFTTTTSPTKGAANDCATPEPEPEPQPVVSPLVINEVESNGDDTDWVELYNTGATPVALGGYTFRDDDDTRTPYTLPAGSVVPGGGFFVVDQAQGTRPGFDFGLGGADSARLYDTAGGLVASYSWTQHASTSYGRCPDGTGDLVTTTVTTKGAPNDCSSPVRINEVESSGGTPGDWVELTSVGAAPVDATGYVLTDADGNRYTLPATTIAPGAHLALDALGFGLGAADGVTLYLPDGTTVVDTFAWTSHAATTYGRCPDGTGEFEVTTAPSKGAVNECAGIVNTQPWPGGPEETPLDDPDTFGGDLSGLDWEAPGTLWAVQNGDGLLYRIDPASGAPEAQWTLAYPGGEAGVVDAEGVTVTGDDSAGGVYVSSERNNAASSTSRPAVLRYLTTGSGGTLTATQEWNLAPDFPGLGANAGLEGITWIPDSFLTAGGFVDERTGAAYAPASYPGHGDGLFFVGVEGTKSVYAYALSADGSFARIATIPTPFALVAEVQFDADLGALWVVCDEACGGRTALYGIGDDGAFAPTAVFNPPADADPGLANEGFAIADESTCVDGFRATFYADDADTDGYALRTGTFPCAPGGGTTPGSGGPGSGGGTGPGAGGGPGSGSGPGAGTQPVAGPGPGTPRPVLAQTGAEVAGWTALAAGLLVAGGAALVVGRRRHG